MIIATGLAMGSHLATGQQLPTRYLALGGQVGLQPRIAFHADPGQSAVRPWPVMPTIRYQRQVVGAEIGLLLYRNTRRNQVTLADGDYLTETESRTWAVPVVVRARFPKPATRRWELAGEAGLLILASRLYTNEYFTDAQTRQTADRVASREVYNDAAVVWGLAGSYAATPRLLLTANARLSWSFLNTVLGAVFVEQPYAAALQPSLSVGASYYWEKQ